MIKFTRDNNRPHTVGEDFWIELSKNYTRKDPILAFMLSPDKTSPRIVHAVEYVEATGRITIYGTDYRWGWEAKHTMSWWDTNDTERFASLEICGPEYLYYYHYAGSTRGVSMPDSIKNRIAFNRETRDYVHNKTIEVLEGVCNTLWHMYGNVEGEVSAYDDIVVGSDTAKYLLIEDNRWLRHECEGLAELILYNSLPEEWGLDDLLFYSVPGDMENDGSVLCYPDDGDGLELHDVTLEEFNKVQRSLAITSISKAIQSIRVWSVERFQYDPHFQDSCQTVDDLSKIG